VRWVSRGLPSYVANDDPGPTRIISAAVTHLPWKGPDGKPLKDVSEFAHCMNFVNIMCVSPTLPCINPKEV
jgi:hypothetical protein